jgi:hypothetical protein
VLSHVKPPGTRDQLDPNYAWRLAKRLSRPKIGAMRRCIMLLLGLLAYQSIPASAQQFTQVNLTYDTYAVGTRVMQMKVFFGVGPWNYQINLAYHTTGLVGVFYRGNQVNTVRGAWDEGAPQPIEFFGKGVWRGQPRTTLIDYDHGQPEIKTLIPPQEAERETVPPDLRTHSLDTMSALVQLMRKVEQSGSCETHARTYDGRRVLDVVARTGPTETLEPDHGSIYRGKALRCDFEGSELAGFLIGQDDPEHRRPLHGSAWLAPLTPGTVPLPVKIAFQTRWFGLTTMYLTGAAQAPHTSPESPMGATARN